MNHPHENQENPTSVDQLHDRLVDRALAEVVGGETPPDLSARIRAADVTLPPPPVDVPRRRRFFHSRWTWLAVAATLLVSVSAVLWQQRPRIYNARVASGPIAKKAPSPAYSPTQTRRWSTAELKQENPPSGGTMDVADGLHDLDATDGRQNDFDHAVDSIRSTVASKEGYGEAAEAPFPTNLSVSISQSQQVQDDIASAASNRLASQNYALAPQERPTPRSPSRDEERLMSGAPAAIIDRLSGERAEGEWRLGLDGFQGKAVRFEKLQRHAEIQGDIGNSPLGTGPGISGDQYARIHENPFIKAIGGDAVSTFSIDVDTASYANVRQFLLDMKQLPPPDAVRIEELVNYFPYDYAGPESDSDVPFAAHMEVAGCPWEPGHRLVRIGIKGREMNRGKRPRSNLVFLVDVSGSMNQPSKLPLVVDGLRQLTRKLGENDRVAIVVYASSEGLALDSTPGTEQQKILGVLDRLQAGGATAGGAGIQLAYQLAEDHFLPEGTNRVILCTDGDFNVGVTSTAELERLVETKAKDTKVFLSVLGFGRGNLNDTMMESISGRGNGNYYYVDSRREARKVFVEEMSGTLVTIAKDVKIQVEFNPAQVAGYRLIGYENRMLRTEDFNDDTKDAGEIGAGHTVTALYEVVPAGQPVAVGMVDDLRYQSTSSAPEAVDAGTDVEGVNNELLTLKIRHKQPDGDVSQRQSWPLVDTGEVFAAASEDFQFAAAVAGFGLLLRDSQYRGTASYDAVLEIATSSLGSDQHVYRAEFLEMVGAAKRLQSPR